MKRFKMTALAAAVVLMACGFAPGGWQRPKPHRRIVMDWFIKMLLQEMSVVR